MPPPGKDALFNGRPGCVASATRSFFSFTSTSVVPPTRMKSINYVRPMGHRDGESASTAGIELRRMGSAFFGCDFPVLRFISVFRDCVASGLALTARFIPPPVSMAEGLYLLHSSMPFPRQFSMFFGVGVAALVVDYGTLVILRQVFGLDPVWGALAGYLAGGILSYTLNRRHRLETDRSHVEAGFRFST